MMTPTKQRKSTSLIESTINIFIGLIINLMAQIVLFPLWGIRISLESTAEIALAFTCISIVRSYAIRRGFEHLRVSGMLP